MKRKAQLEDLGLDAEEASATVESFDGVNDEAFDKAVVMNDEAKKYAPEKADEHGEKEDKKKTLRRKSKKSLMQRKLAKKFLKKQRLRKK